MSRARKWMLAVAAALASVVLAVAVGIPIARARLHHAIESRCSAAIRGTCQVGGLNLARDGVVATRITARSALPGLAGEVGAVAIRLSWSALLLGREQGVTVRVSNVTVADDAPLELFAREIRALRTQRHERAGRRHTVRIDRVVVEGVSARARLATLASARLEGGALDWTRGGTSSARWRNVSVQTGPVTPVQTGQCSLTREPDAPQAVVECRGFSTRIDLDTAGERLDLLREIVRVARGAADGAPSSAAGGADRPSAAAAGTSAGAAAEGDAQNVAREALGFALELRGREGAVVVARGAQQIVELQPASFRVQIARDGSRTAQVRFGAERTGPAIQADVTATAADAWRADVAGDSLPLAEIARWVPGVPWHGVERGRTSMRVHAEPAERPGVVTVDGELGLEDFGLMHRGLSREPIDGLAVHVRGAARLDLVRRRIETEGLHVGLNGVTVAVAGWAERSHEHTALDAALRLPTMSCDAIRRAMPPVVVGPVRDLTFGGQIAADVHLALDTRNLPATEFDVNVDESCQVMRDAMPNGLARLNGPFVQRAQEPQGVRAFVTGPGTATWVPLGEISPFMPRAVVSREDGRFYRHHGFDAGEVRGAIIRNVGAGRFVYGASTISMQLAKNVFLQREKTLVRKLQEVVLTWYIERSLDKDSILELYLNVVEFGPGIYGVGPAARFFFGREPRDLTPLQAIYLATLLPSPVARFENYQRGGVGPRTLAGLRAHAHVMAVRGMLTPEEEAFAQSEALVFRPASTPVAGALTQTVDPESPDAVAANAAARYAAARHDSTPDGDAGDETEPVRRVGGADVEDVPVRMVGPSSAITPVSVRTGGTL